MMATRKVTGHVHCLVCSLSRGCWSDTFFFLFTRCALSISFADLHQCPVKGFEKVSTTVIVHVFSDLSYSEKSITIIKGSCIRIKHGKDNKIIVWTFWLNIHLLNIHNLMNTDTFKSTSWLAVNFGFWTIIDKIFSSILRLECSSLYLILCTMRWSFCSCFYHCNFLTSVSFPSSLLSITSTFISPLARHTYN